VLVAGYLFSSAKLGERQYLTLLVSDKVLRACNDTSALDTRDSVGHCLTLKVWISAKAFRNTASLGKAAKRASSRAKKDIHALAMSLGAHAMATIAPKMTTPGCAGSYTNGEGAVVIGKS
jgi:hypothetical protein